MPTDIYQGDSANGAMTKIGSGDTPYTVSGLSPRAEPYVFRLKTPASGAFLESDFSNPYAIHVLAPPTTVAQLLSDNNAISFAANSTTPYDTVVVFQKINGAAPTEVYRGGPMSELQTVMLTDYGTYELYAQVGRNAGALTDGTPYGSSTSSIGNVVTINRVQPEPLPGVITVSTNQTTLFLNQQHFTDQGYAPGVNYRVRIDYDWYTTYIDLINPLQQIKLRSVSFQTNFANRPMVNTQDIFGGVSNKTLINANPAPQRFSTFLNFQYSNTSPAAPLYLAGWGDVQAQDGSWVPNQILQNLYVTANLTITCTARL